MKKLTIGIILISLIIIGFGLYMFLQPQVIILEPCQGYTEVDEFENKINTEDEAKQVALDYYKSIGYDFNLEDLTTRKLGNNWSIKFDYSKINVDLCKGFINPPECIGQELVLEEKLSGKNKILMEYQIPC